MKKISGYYPLWRVFDLERLMDREEGFFLTKLGQFSCTFREDEAARGNCFRIGAYLSRKGSADEVRYVTEWQKKGWEKFYATGKLLFFRAPQGTALPEDDGLLTLLKKEIRWREKVRNMMLILAALCLIIGYPMEGFTVVRLAALPLLIALPLTWEVSKLQKAAAQCENRT